MSEPKKFLFDNFVVNVSRKRALKQDAVEDLQEVEEIVLEEDNKIVEENKEIEEKLLKQAEVDAQMQKMEQEIYNKAFIDATDKNKQQEMQLLNTLNENMLTLLKEEDVVDDALEQKIVRFGLLIVEKLIPTLEKEQAAKVVEQFLEKNFNSFKVEKKLLIYLNPQNISVIGSVIQKLADKNDFEGKISIIKDENLSVFDCKVLWDFGGVELSQAKIVDKIKEKLNKGD